MRVAGPSAFASVLWRQRDDHDELLHEFACQYLLVGMRAEWKIVTIVNETES